MLTLNRSYDSKTNVLSISIAGKLPERYRDEFNKFLAAYDFIQFLIDDKAFDQQLTPKRDRVCRFCKKNAKETSFSARAHLIPELLGNKSIFTDGECDKCNQEFSIFENDFANYIGIARSFAQKRGKKGFPKFKNPDGSLIVREGPMNEGDLDKKIIFESLSTGSETFSLDHDKGVLSINATRHPYVPARVYKALLKMAILALPEEDVARYESAIAELKSDNDRAGSNVFLTNIWVAPGPPIASPLAYLCRKKDASAEILSHTFVLYFQNYIYQIFIPGCKDDFWMCDGKHQLTFLGAPPFIDERWGDHFGYPAFYRMDFSSNKTVRDEQQVLTFSFDPSQNSTTIRP